MKRKKPYKTLELWAIKALERDNYLCVECHSDKLMLVVHHIDESRKLGVKNMNNELNNLVTLCKHCHAITHHQDLRTNFMNRSRAFELRSQGLTYQQIGDTLGCTRQNACKILKKYAGTPH